MALPWRQPNSERLSRQHRYPGSSMLGRVRSPAMRRALAILALPAGLSACEAPPPTCNPITQEQNDSIYIGMPIEEVQQFLGKRLTLVLHTEGMILGGPRFVAEVWQWGQNPPIDSCSQTVTYETMNGLVEKKNWAAPVK